MFDAALHVFGRGVIGLVIYCRPCLVRTGGAGTYVSLLVDIEHTFCSDSRQKGPPFLCIKDQICTERVLGASDKCFIVRYCNFYASVATASRTLTPLQLPIDIQIFALGIYHPYSSPDRPSIFR
jgi:hypothetical protein